MTPARPARPDKIFLASRYSAGGGRLVMFGGAQTGATRRCNFFNVESLPCNRWGQAAHSCDVGKPALEGANTQVAVRKANASERNQDAIKMGSKCGIKKMSRRIDMDQMITRAAYIL